MILYLVQILFFIFIAVKSYYEIKLNDIAVKEGKPVYESVVHVNQHILMLIFIIVYSIINILIYSLLLFQEDMLFQVSVFLFFKYSLLNLGWLILISHIRQERLDKVREFSFWELFRW